MNHAKHANQICTRFNQRIRTFLRTSGVLYGKDIYRILRFMRYEKPAENYIILVAMLVAFVD